jgi:hypothetical protein
MRILWMLAFLFSVCVKADDISEYRYYQTSMSGSYLAYLKKDDACVYAGDLEGNDIRKYCKMGNSGLNLKTDSPTIYAAVFTLELSSLSFTVAAPWNEQKCIVSMSKNTIVCESTGR